MSQWFFKEHAHKHYIPAARKPDADNYLVSRLPWANRFRLALSLSHLLVVGGLPGGGHWDITQYRVFELVPEYWMLERISVHRVYEVSGLRIGF